MEEKQGKKIIVVENKEKVSPQLLENIKQHYGCDVEIISKEEYKARVLNDFAEGMIDHLQKKMTFEIRKVSHDSVLNVPEKIKPEWTKKIGDVRRKSFKTYKQHNNQRKGR